MTDETRTDAKPRYEWQSNGGCERCDESDVRYVVDHSGNIHHGSGSDPDEEFDLIFDYGIICWGNTERISGEVTVSRTYGELNSGALEEDFIEDALVEAIDKVHVIAASECPTCPAPPLVS